MMLVENSFGKLTCIAASLMNCLAAGFQIAGTVSAQVTSEALNVLPFVWLDIMSRA